MQMNQLRSWTCGLSHNSHACWTRSQGIRLQALAARLTSVEELREPRSEEAMHEIMAVVAVLISFLVAPQRDLATAALAHFCASPYQVCRSHCLASRPCAALCCCCRPCMCQTWTLDWCIICGGGHACSVVSALS